MSETFPRTGLFVSEQELSAEVLDALGGVRLEATDLARLREGGARALCSGHEAWIEACRPSPEALAAGAADIARLRQAMVEAVVSPAIALLSLACTFGLALFAAGLVFPPIRRWAFTAAGVVAVLMVVWATFRSLRSARTQARLQDELHAAADALTALRQGGDRPRLYALALDLENAPREPATVRWNHPAADPERLLVLPRALIEDDAIAWLVSLAKARAMIIEGSPVLEHPEAQALSVS